MDIYDFLDYFTEKYNLRERIIYTDDASIVCSVINDDRAICMILNPNNITIDKANEYCERIRKYIDSHSEVDIFELYKNGCSVQNFYDFLMYEDSKNSGPGRYHSSPYFKRRGKDLKEAPNGVDQDVYEEALTRYMVDRYHYNENEIKTTIFKHKSVFPAEYEELCLLTKMVCTGTKYNLSSIAYRPTMSYSGDFKYHDIFTKSSKICKLIKNTLPDIASDIKQAWIYSGDSNILLINMPSYHFLTTVDMLVDDLKITRAEFEQFVN